MSISSLDRPVFFDNIKKDIATIKTLNLHQPHINRRAVIVAQVPYKSNYAWIKTVLKIGFIATTFSAVGYLLLEGYENHISPSRDNHDFSKSLTLKFYEKFSKSCDSYSHKFMSIFFDVFKGHHNGVRGAILEHIADHNYPALRCFSDKGVGLPKDIRDQMIIQLLKHYDSVNTFSFMKYLGSKGPLNLDVIKYNNGKKFAEYRPLVEAALRLKDMQLTKWMLQSGANPNIEAKEKKTLIDAAISLNAKLSSRNLLDTRLDQIVSDLISFNANPNSCRKIVDGEVLSYSDSCFKHPGCDKLSFSTVWSMESYGAEGDPCFETSIPKVIFNGTFDFLIGLFNLISENFRGWSWNYNYKPQPDLPPNRYDDLAKVGLDDSATREKIRKACKEVAYQHPDKNPGMSLDDSFKFGEKAEACRRLKRPRYYTKV